MSGQTHRNEAAPDLQIETGAFPSPGATPGVHFKSTCRVCLLSTFAGALGVLLLYLLIATGIVYAIP